MPFRTATSVLALAAVLAANPDRAGAQDFQVSVFGGMNWNFSSPVTLSSPIAGTDRRDVDWEGKPFQMPPYWGVRGTYWMMPASSFGIGAEFIHAKAYSKINFATDPVYSHLEFTDGNNLLFVNAMYRFNPMLDRRLTPYVGVGAGIAVPHVEVILKGVPAPQNRTWEYQFAGGAAQALAGLEWSFDRNWSAFAEAKISYSHLATDLADGGHLKTYLWQPHLAIGLTYRFGGQ